MSVYDEDYAESRLEANDLYLGMDWPDPPEGDDGDPEDEEGRGRDGKPPAEQP